MPSIDIYAILSSKPHNAHFLNRYYNFIQYCFRANLSLDKTVYTEIHHICPKSKDLFPEYNCLRINNWNKVVLTARQHFLAHWMLFKAYRTQGTAYSLRAMGNGQSNQYQSRSKSKNYELVKQVTAKIISESRRGTATYKDSQCKVVTCSTSDPRVVSGELVSTSKGRRYKWKNIDQENYSNLCVAKTWKRFPTRKIKLFFLEYQVTLEYTKENFTFLPYLEQGWQIGQTIEHKSMVASNSNKNRSIESRKRAGENISKRIQNKRKAGIELRRKPTIEERKHLRKGGRDYTALFFDTIKNEFVVADIFEESDTLVKCFTKPGNLIWDINGNKAYLNKKLTTLPKGYFSAYPLGDLKVFDKRNNFLKQILVKDFDEMHHVKVSTPKCERVCFLDIDTDKNVYLSKGFVENYGVPLNLYRLNTQKIQQL